MADVNIAYKKAKEIIENFPDIHCIYVAEGITPACVAKAIKEMGKAGKIYCIGHDITPEVYQSLIDRSLTAVVTQDLYFQGYNSVIALFNYLSTRTKPEDPLLFTENDIVSLDNINSYWDKQKGFILGKGFETRFLQPLGEPKDQKKIFFIGEERWELHQQIKKGVLDVADKLFKFNVEVRWLVPPGQEVAKAPSLSAEEIKAYIESIIEEEKPDGIVVKVPYDTLVPYLNRLAEKDIIISTYQTEPLSLRGFLDQTHRDAVKIFYVSNIINGWSTELKTTMNLMVQSIQDILDGANLLRDQILKGKDAITELSNSVETVQKGVLKQINEVEHSSKETKILSNSIDKVKDQIKNIEEVKAEVEKSVIEIDKLNKLSKNITNIIDVIDNIAVKTNVLALNAGILSAKAGDKGKSFSVIANEIRKLSINSGKSANDILTLINDIREIISIITEYMNHSKTVTDQYTETINISAEELKVISIKFSNVLEAVVSVAHENDSASLSMNGSSNVVTELINNVASVTEENSASISQITSSITEIASQSESILITANNLQKLSQSLRSSVLRFHISDEEIN